MKKILFTFLLTISSTAYSAEQYVLNCMGSGATSGNPYKTYGCSDTPPTFPDCSFLPSAINVVAGEIATYQSYCTFPSNWGTYSCNIQSAGTCNDGCMEIKNLGDKAYRWQSTGVQSACDSGCTIKPSTGEKSKIRKLLADPINPLGGANLEVPYIGYGLADGTACSEATVTFEDGVAITYDSVGNSVTYTSDSSSFTAPLSVSGEDSSIETAVQDLNTVQTDVTSSTDTAGEDVIKDNPVIVDASHYDIKVENDITDALTSATVEVTPYTSDNSGGDIDDGGGDNDSGTDTTCSVSCYKLVYQTGAGTPTQQATSCTVSGALFPDGSSASQCQGDSTDSTSNGSVSGTASGTSTTTTTNSDGTTTTSEQTLNLDGVATSDGQAEILKTLKEGNDKFDATGTTVAENCEAPPTCDIKKPFCVVLMQDWKMSCKSKEADDEYLTNIATNPFNGREELTEEINIQSWIADITNTEIQGSCPASSTVSILGASYSISSQPFCDFASLIRPIVLMIGIFMVIRIVARS